MARIRKIEIANFRGIQLLASQVPQFAPDFGTFSQASPMRINDIARDLRKLV